MTGEVVESVELEDPVEPVVETVEADVPAAAAGRPAHRGTPTRSRATAEPVPRFVEFRPGNVLAYVFGTLFTIFSVGAVLTILWAVSDGGSRSIIGAAALTALAMVSWWALLNWAPPVVSISNGILEVSRGSKSKSWDLRDPDTHITFRGRPSSRTWKAALRTDEGRTVTIPARLVDPAQFVQLVEHYQASGPEIDDAS
jgi:hypothetical protein